MNEIFNVDQKSIVDFADVKGQHRSETRARSSSRRRPQYYYGRTSRLRKNYACKTYPNDICRQCRSMKPLRLRKSIQSPGSFLPTLPLVSIRPYRSPHHTISDVALVGGGPAAKPGEISFRPPRRTYSLMSCPNSKRMCLEVMRQPLEDGRVTISRSKSDRRLSL
jgi:magnesium chelatase family protein